VVSNQIKTILSAFYVIKNYPFGSYEKLHFKLIEIRTKCDSFVLKTVALQNPYWNFFESQKHENQKPERNIYSLYLKWATTDVRLI
jgi:hypothetical protein